MKPAGYVFIGISLGLLLELQNVQANLSVDRTSVYVSKTCGLDTSECGSHDSPCKTLNVGLKNLVNGGRLFVDANKSQEDPYSCDPTRGTLRVEKGFVMSMYPGQDTNAYISCTSGIFVQSSPDSINISGITFTSTTIVLKDTPAAFNDCVFKESSLPIDVKVSKPVTQYALNVSNSLFQGNMGCIRMNSKNGRCNTVTLNLFNVVFKENTVRLDNEESLGIIDVRGSMDCNGKTTVLSYWTNVTVKYNRQTRSARCPGPFNTKNHLSSSFFEVHAHNANLNFSRIASLSNVELRFLMINSSSHSNVSVTYSNFSEHCLTRNIGAVFYMTSAETATEMRDERYARIYISNCNLWSNTALSGGTLQMDSIHIIHLMIINSNITNSYGTIKGCAVCVGNSSLKALPGKLFVLLDGFGISHSESPCHYKKTTCYQRFLGIMYLGASDVLQAHIQNSFFWLNGNYYQPMFFIEHKASTFHKDNNLKVVIVKTSFDENKSSLNGAILKIFARPPQYMKESNLTILNADFTHNEGLVLRTQNLKTIHIKNVACITTRGQCFKLTTTIKKVRPSIHIINSVFIGNSYSPLTIYQKQVTCTNILLKNISFHNNYDSVASPDRFIMILIRFNERKSRLVHGYVVLDQVKFTSNVLSYSELLSIVIFPHYPGNVSVLMHDCTFKDNQQQQKNNRSVVSKLVYMSMPSDDVMTIDKHKCAFVFNYSNYFQLHNVRFKNNTCYSSLLYINNGKTTFTRCVFKDNFSHEPAISAYVFAELGKASIEFQNTSFAQSKLKTFEKTTDLPVFVKLPEVMPFLYFNAKGPLILRNSSFILDTTELTTRIFIISNGGFFHLDNDTSLLCPVGSFIETENSSHIVPADCSLIPNCTLNITRVMYVCRRCPDGFYSLLRGKFQERKKTYIECFRCPFGGECSHNVQSKWTYWGYKTVIDPPQLNFIRCPEKYCKFPKTIVNHSVYNHCNGNRTGVLCGSCKNEYTESMFDQRCRLMRECKDSWFWLIVFVYALAMSLYIMYQPSLVLLFVRKVLWFTNVNGNDSHDQHHEYGYSKIIFFHYQIAILYSINPEIVVQKYKVIFSIVSLYNFEIKSADSSSGCPFPGLNAVTKEVFRSLQVFAAMAVVVVIYMLFCVFCLLTRRARPNFAAYMAAIVEILLLGYERLGHTSLELLNCVPMTINDRTEWRLFLDGNITCWVHWWQYALIAYNIIFVLPFLVVLFIGTTKLRQQQITAVQFVAACFVPLPFLIYWNFKHLCSKSGQTIRTTGYKEMRKTLLDVIQGPFKSPSSLSKDTLYWESLLIGRRLVFLCLRFLVASPMYRLLSMTLVSVAILVHEVVVLPYKDNKANALSLFTLSINVALATVNLCKSTFYSFGIFPEEKANNHFKMLEMLEIALLCIVPGVVAVLIVAAIATQIGRVAMKLCQYCITLSQNIIGNTGEGGRDDITQRLICPVNEDDEDPDLSINR